MENELLISLWSGVTFLGDWRFIVPAALFWVWFLVFRRLRIEALAFGVFLLVAEALTYLIKVFVARPRPLDGLVVSDDPYSFPSGHTTMAVVFYGMMLSVALNRPGLLPLRRRTLLMAFFVLLALIGASRIFLGVHYLSDVLAGYGFGGLFLAFFIVFRERLLRKKSFK